MFAHITPAAANCNRRPAPAGQRRTRQEARFELFEALRVESYPLRARYRSRVLWELRVLEIARTINSATGLAVRDGDVVRLAERHAAWCWRMLADFVVYNHDPEVQAWKGRRSGIFRRRKARPRDRMIAALLTEHPGTTFTAVAAASGISRTQVMRVLQRDMPELYRVIRLRFRTMSGRAGRTAPARLLRSMRRLLRPEKADGRGGGGRSRHRRDGNLTKLIHSPCQPRSGGDRANLAEEVGFEPTVELPPRRFSRPVHSTTLSLLQLKLHLVANQGELKGYPDADSRNCPFRQKCIDGNRLGREQQSRITYR